LRVRPSHEPPLPFLAPSPYSLNLSEHPLDLLHKNRSAGSFQTEYNVMQTKLAWLIVIKNVGRISLRIRDGAVVRSHRQAEPRESLSFS
jgi:hypothetical protein